MNTMKRSAKTNTRRPGRPLSFDRQAVLERAMHVFWRTGYETSSIADLTQAMGITAPSLYSAFGDKKHLFLEAMRLYLGDEESAARQIALAPSALEAARGLLHASAIVYTGENSPPGCLLASSTATGSNETDDIRRLVGDVRRKLLSVLEKRIKQDLRKRMMKPRTDAFALAAHVIAVQLGLSVLARDGLTRSELISISEESLRGWPTS